MDASNIYKWNAYLSGPEDSPYKDSFFNLKILLDSDYPVKAPKIK